MLGTCSSHSEAHARLHPPNIRCSPSTSTSLTVQHEHSNIRLYQHAKQIQQYCLFVYETFLSFFLLREMLKLARGKYVIPVMTSRKILHYEHPNGKCNWILHTTAVMNVQLELSNSLEIS